MDSPRTPCIFCGPDHPEGRQHSDAEIRSYELGRKSESPMTASQQYVSLGHVEQVLNDFLDDTDGGNALIDDVLDALNGLDGRGGPAAAAATPSLDVRGPQAIEALDRIQRAVLLMGRVAADGTLVTESVVVDEAREALRDFHAAARLDEGSATPEPPGGAKVYLAHLIEQWDTDEDAFFGGMEQAVEEARQYLIETSEAEARG